MLGIGFLLVALALISILYSMGPMIVEKPALVNRYIQDTQETKV